LKRAAFSLFVLVSAYAATIHYAPLPRGVIEKHLRDLPTTNLDREVYLRTTFERFGCTTEEQPVKHSKVPNVICRLPGESQAEIVVGAHFDFIPKGTGAIDNWSGASLLPSLYASLESVKRRHTFVFVGFTDEEKGLWGSAYYVSKLSKEQRQRISAMVNMDSLGTSPTKLELERGDKGLANALSSVAKTFNLPLNVVNVHKVGISDSDSFEDKKIPSINIHSMTQETFPLLHTSGDQLTAIRMDDYYDTYKLMSAYIAYLDVILNPEAQPPASSPPAPPPAYR